MKVRSVATGLVFDWPEGVCESLMLTGAVEPVEAEPKPAKKAAAKPSEK